MKNRTTAKSILIIEDEKPLLAAIKTKLEKSGFDVVSARTAAQGLGYLKDLADIDLIWLDHYLIGKESGLDFVTAIKNDERFRKIPVFVISNTASQEKIHSYLNFGVDRYYTKADYRLDQIVADIKAALQPQTAIKP